MLKGNKKWTSLFSVILTLMLLPTACTHKKPHNEAKSIYIRAALNGDLSDINNQLSQTTGAEAVLNDFEHKFIAKNHGMAVEDIKDALIKQILYTYIEYWRQSLLNPQMLEAHESALKSQLVELAIKYLDLAPSTAYEEIKKPVTEYIESKGYGVLIFGRIQPLIDVLIWRSNDQKSYNVELTDSIQPVEVMQIGDFISYGWSHYATHGAASTGGWASPDMLYCVCDGYDEESEKYQVSYLKHEARHFADYQIYPKLESATLEYRAKLTELAFADESMHRLLKHFSASGVKDTANAHPLANWHVIEDMAHALNKEVDDKHRFDWESIDVSTIQSTARKLLKQNDALLQSLGPEEVTNTIHPQN